MKTKALLLGLIMTSAMTLAKAETTLADQNISELEIIDITLNTAIDTWSAQSNIIDLTEENLNIENWMIDMNRSWSNFSAEDDLRMEAWMIDLEKFSEYSVNEEEAMKTEDWMINLDSWGDRN